MKKYLEGLLQDCESELTKEVIEIALDDIDNYKNSIGYFEDVLQYGCANGMVSELIYYYQTEEFFDRHVDEILEIYDTILGQGVKLNIEINRNNLSWLAFEETIRSLYDDYMATIEED